MPMIIVAERPNTRDARALIAELKAHLAPLYPAESRHGFSIQKLLQEGVAFFVMRHAGFAVGCGGVQLLDREYAEVKMKS
jgi:putative acetyltransferase